jgi:excisionase family DNA binding protein
MKISAQEAAARLGVSRMQISRLVANGDILADRFGRSLQIDVDSLNRYAELRPPRGRPLPPGSAWAAITAAAAGGGAAGGGAAPGSLAFSAVKQLAIVARRRAERRPMRVMPSALERVLNDPAVVVSGADAAAHRGAAVQSRPPHSVYVRASDLADLVARHRMRSNSDEPNLIVRVAPDDSPVFNGEHHAPLIVAALDMVDDRDDRSAAEALR